MGRKHRNKAREARYPIKEDGKMVWVSYPNHREYMVCKWHQIHKTPLMIHLHVWDEFGYRGNVVALTRGAVDIQLPTGVVKQFRLSEIEVKING